MDVKSLRGIAVVSVEEGEKVGTVVDLLFDLQARKVVAFRLTQSTLRRSGGQFISMDDIESIGPDAIMIQNRQRVRLEKDHRAFQNMPDLSAVSSLRVVTEDGTYVGNLSTFQFDQKTGQLTEIEITGGGMLDMLRRNKQVPASAVVSVGTDVIVVPDSYGPGKVESTPDEESAPIELEARTGNSGEGQDERPSHREISQ